MKSLVKTLIITGIVLLGVVPLNSFKPQPSHFIDEYQYTLFLSWINRSGFADEGPAILSQHNFIITFENRITKEQATADFDLIDGKIAIQLERIPTIETAYETVESRYRYYLEQLLYRLNSGNTFFVTDFTEHFEIDLLLGNEQDSKIIVSGLQSQEVGTRLSVTSGAFRQNAEGLYYYNLFLNNRYSLTITFNNQDDFPKMLRSLRSKEAVSEKISDLPFPQRRDFTYHKTVPDTYQRPDYSHPSIPHPSIPHPPVLKPIPTSLEGVTMSDFIKEYHNRNWGREMLHNKITNHERFLRREFPGHNFSKNRSEISLNIDQFQGHFSGNLRLVERSLRDGMMFTSSSSYVIDEQKKVTLATGETVSMEELTSEEIDIIAPYMNQLITMHRVMGTKLINFLLIPAEVPTTLVIRDPDREVLQLESYTDLILMLSHYWSESNVYFNIDTVKKINNYVELAGTLVAHNRENDYFDYAEVMFSLDRYQRIDIAMFILHTNVRAEDQ